MIFLNTLASLCHAAVRGTSSLLLRAQRVPGVLFGQSTTSVAACAGADRLVGVGTLAQLCGQRAQVRTRSAPIAVALSAPNAALKVITVARAVPATGGPAKLAEGMMRNPRRHASPVLSRPSQLHLPSKQQMWPPVCRAFDYFLGYALFSVLLVLTMLGDLLVSPSVIVK